MALNKDILGQALFDVRNPFCNRTYNDLLAQYGTDDGVRMALSVAEAEVIINHFTGNTEVAVNVNTTGTATAQHGSGTGTIS